MAEVWSSDEDGDGGRPGVLEASPMGRAVRCVRTTQGERIGRKIDEAIASGRTGMILIKFSNGRLKGASSFVPDDVLAMVLDEG